MLSKKIEGTYRSFPNKDKEFLRRLMLVCDDHIAKDKAANTDYEYMARCYNLITRGLDTPEDPILIKGQTLETR